MKRTVRMPSIEDEDVLPLPDGALTTNLGLDLVIVVTKVTYCFIYIAQQQKNTNCLFFLH